MQALKMNVMGRVGIVAVGLLASGCYPKSGPAPGSISPKSVEWASSKWPGTTEASLSAGRTTFLAKCNGCHGYPDFAEIADDRWPAIVARMGKKAELDQQKTSEVEHYILATKHP